MIRSAASKVMWVGRATVFLVGLAVILALVFGVATTALAGTGVGATFNLGKVNSVDRISKLVGSAASSMLMVDNNGTGPALSLKVGDPTTPAADKTTPPMTVDSQAEVANLNAQFAGQADNAAHADSADSAANATSAAEAGNAGTLDNMNSTEFALALHNHDDRYYTEGEVNTALSGKANVNHQHSGADITSGTVAEARIDPSVARDGEVMPTVKANDGAGSGVDADMLDGRNSSDFAGAGHNHDGRYYFSGSKVADSDKLDNKDSSAFGIRTDHAWNHTDSCDTPDIWNECAPVTVTVPEGKNYIVSVWSSFSAKDGGGAGASQVLEYCSAGKGPSISTTNPCVTPFGYSNFVHVHDYLVAASSSGETVSLSPGSYTFFTAIRPPDRQLATSSGKVITKVMVRDATNGL